LVATEYDLAPGINVCGEADEKVPAVAFWKRMSARAPKPAPRRRVAPSMADSTSLAVDSAIKPDNARNSPGFEQH
jgi:hypothetical protein